ncbi:MAG: hypothetical protein KatS3mg053_1631 [Candidatus Roseilinea sp.]|nr:MAG: hypothetical protein KatS3mg053_1631 [Candidatus Roseilinea sp.]
MSHTTNFRHSKIIASLVAASMALAACATATPAAPAPTTAAAPAEPTAAAPEPTAPAAEKIGLFEGTPPEPANKEELAKLSGEISIDGSSTVYPVTAAAVEEFNKYAPNMRIAVGISGTGGGFKKFCNNETDISNASRPILPAEREACAKNNIEFIEIPVAFDGLAVVVSKDNTFASCIKASKLKEIWQPDSQGKTFKWSDIDPSWPNENIVLFGAGSDSGTFDYFTEAIVGKGKSSRGDYQASEDDNVLVQGVSGDQYALGYFGYAYVVENTDKIRAVAIDYDLNPKTGEPTPFAGKCVEPNFETIKNGTYQPLSRPIFIYVKAASVDKPGMKEFINFYLSPSFTPLIQSREVGYVELERAIYEAAAKRFNNRVLGTLFPNGEEVGATLDRYLQN